MVVLRVRSEEDSHSMSRADLSTKTSGPVSIGWNARRLHPIEDDVCKTEWEETEKKEGNHF